MLPIQRVGGGSAQAHLGPGAATRVGPKGASSTAIVGKVLPKAPAAPPQGRGPSLGLPAAGALNLPCGLGMVLTGKDRNLPRDSPDK